MLVIITASLLISLIFAPLGCLNLWKRYVYFGDGLAHASLLAASISIILSINIHYTSVIVAFCFAFLIFKFKSKSGNSEIINIVSNSMLALALILNYFSPISFNIDQLLFGDIISTSPEDLIILSTIFVITSCFFILSYNQIILLVLNRDIAQIRGIKTHRIELIFLILLSLAIFSTVKIVGALLVSSILIMPATSAKLISKSPAKMILNSIIISIFSSLSGLVISFYLDLPIAPVIILIGFCLYLLIFLLKSNISRRLI